MIFWQFIQRWRPIHSYDLLLKVILGVDGGDRGDRGDRGVPQYIGNLKGVPDLGEKRESSTKHLKL